MTDLFTAHRGVDTQTEEKILARLYGEPLEECPDGLYIPPEALRVFLASFEGPLDLLLYLIRKQKFDVMDIPMAELTDQYMRYVDLVRESDLELAAAYLVMSATLMQIKSRLLLPSVRTAEGTEPEDPRAELMRRLEEYEAAAFPRQLIEGGRQALGKGLRHRERLLPVFLRGGLTQRFGQDLGELGFFGAVHLGHIDHPDDQGRPQHPAVVGRERCGHHEQRHQAVGAPVENGRFHTACPRRRSSSLIASSIEKPWARNSSMGALSSSLLENSRWVAGSRMARATPSPTGEEM